MVFDAMGPSTASMARSFPASDDKFKSRCRYPLWTARSILRQTLHGLAYLHSNGIVHGDLQPGNLLFSAKDLKTLDERLLFQQHVDLPGWEKEGINLKNEPEPNRPAKKGIAAIPENTYENPDLHLPRYLAYSQDLSDFVVLDRNFRIKISDLGGAYLMDQPPIEAVTPLGLRSPELVIEGTISNDQDIWSFGCLIFEFITGKKLFSINDFDFGGSNEEAEEADSNGEALDPNSSSFDDEHLLGFTYILGTLPQRMRARWPRSPIYFNENGEIIKNYIGPLPEGFDPSTIPATPPLRQLFEKETPPDMAVEELELVKDLLCWILQYDSSKRPSISDLLKHKWFQEPCDT